MQSVIASGKAFASPAHRLQSHRAPSLPSPARQGSRATRLVVRSDMTDFINKLTVAIQNSPLAEGKKALAKFQAGNYDVEATRAMMDKYIQDNPVMVFSFSTCPFCVKAKKILDETGAKYEAIELDQLPEGYAIRAELAEKTGRTSMPNIWINGKSIGGCNDGPGIITLQANGSLLAMLEEAGALVNQV